MSGAHRALAPKSLLKPAMEFAKLLAGHGSGLFRGGVPSACRARPAVEQEYATRRSGGAVVNRLLHSAPPSTFFHCQMSPRRRTTAGGTGPFSAAKFGKASSSRLGVVTAVPGHAFGPHCRFGAWPRGGAVSIRRSRWPLRYGCPKGRRCAWAQCGAIRDLGGGFQLAVSGHLPFTLLSRRPPCAVSLDHATEQSDERSTYRTANSCSTRVVGVRCAQANIVCTFAPNTERAFWTRHHGDSRPYAQRTSVISIKLGRS